MTEQTAAAAFDALFAEWDMLRKQDIEDDDEAERLNEIEEKLAERIMGTPATSTVEIIAKLTIAEHYIKQVGSRWSDERDLRLLTSAKGDIERLAKEGQP